MSWRLAWIAFFAIAACARRGTVKPNDLSMHAGTVRALSGLPGGRLTLVPRDSLIRPATLVGGDSIALSNAVGLEVEIFGRLTPQASNNGVRNGATLRVERFVVTSANGHRAVDGIVGGSNGRPELILQDGTRLPVPYLPPSLALRAGARVFLAGPLSAPPLAYGVLRAP